MIAETATRRLLGLQVLGAGTVDKITDIAVVGISQSMKLDDFDPLDFAYVPPFSTAIHPFGPGDPQCPLDRSHFSTK